MGTICGPNNCHGPRYPSEVVTLPSLSPDDEFGSFLSEHPGSSIEFLKAAGLSLQGEFGLPLLSFSATLVQAEIVR